jgi:maleate isomerase
MSGRDFFDGEKGADRFTREVEEAAGVKISIGSDACTAAVRAYGGVKRIAVLSPYWPSMNTEVARYFSDKGFTVVRDKCLQCRSWIQIAEQTTKSLRAELMALDGDDVDAIVQVGTNLSMVRLAAAAEMWLGKPIIAINTATYWHALRTNGIKDQKEGFGRLLSEF